jgi:hypothetical protein
MNKENSTIAAEIKQKSVIDMALTFTAMIRLFEKGSKPKISKRLYEEFKKLREIREVGDFQAFHDEFCEWFTNSIRVAQKERNGTVIKECGFSLYGHAAKLLDVALKVYVYYSGLPDKETSGALIPFLNSAVDNPILRHLKEAFPDEIVNSKTVEQIDKQTYKKLQQLIKADIRATFADGIVPTQYDDIMWYCLNREQ